MPDPFANVQPGDDVIYSAAAENAKRGAAKAWRDSQRNQRFDGPDTTRRADIIKIRNDTGGDLDRRSVLGLDGPLFNPADDEDAFLREVIFNGIVPTNEHRGRFAITLEPAPDQRVVRAYVSGLCQVKIDMVHIGHSYADITPGVSDILTSCGCGSAKILWCESEGEAAYDDNAYGYDTGEQWAVVRLGNEAGRGRGCKAPTGGIPPANSDGTSPGHAVCDMYDWDASAMQWRPSGVQETVFSNGGAHTEEAKILNVVYLQGTPFVVVDPCP